jgi:hypothetical protein
VTHPAMLARSVSQLLRDGLPADWYHPALHPGPVLAVTASPARTVEYRVVLGGKHPPPEGGVLYGRPFPPHPLAIALWRLALDAPGFLLVARIHELTPGSRATGERPAEVRRFDPGDPVVAVDWIVREVRKMYAEKRAGVPYVSGKDHRAAVAKIEAERAEVARVAMEARARAEAAEKAERDRYASTWKVKRGHRVQTAP